MIILFYAGIIGLLTLVQGFYIVILRRKHKIGLGDGNEQGLIRATRTLGNTTEWLPLTLLLLALLELEGYLGYGWLHALGIILIGGRLSHAFSLLYAEPRLDKILFRQLGMFATWGVLGIAAVSALF